MSNRLEAAVAYTSIVVLSASFLTVGVLALASCSTGPILGEGLSASAASHVVASPDRIVYSDAQVPIVSWPKPEEITDADSAEKVALRLDFFQAINPERSSTLHQYAADWKNAANVGGHSLRGAWISEFAPEKFRALYAEVVKQ